MAPCDPGPVAAPGPSPSPGDHDSAPPHADARERGGAEGEVVPHGIRLDLDVDEHLAVVAAPLHHALAPVHGDRVALLRDTPMFAASDR